MSRIFTTQFMEITAPDFVTGSLDQNLVKIKGLEGVSSFDVEISAQGGPKFRRQIFKNQTQPTLVDLRPLIAPLDLKQVKETLITIVDITHGGAPIFFTIVATRASYSGGRGGLDGGYKMEHIWVDNSQPVKFMPLKGNQIEIQLRDSVTFAVIAERTIYQSPIITNYEIPMRLSQKETGASSFTYTGVTINNFIPRACPGTRVYVGYVNRWGMMMKLPMFIKPGSFENTYKHRGVREKLEWSLADQVQDLGKNMTRKTLLTLVGLTPEQADQFSDIVTSPWVVVNETVQVVATNKSIKFDGSNSITLNIEVEEKCKTPVYQ